MCGNTIGQDRRFLVKYMPKLEAFFHYRNLDVSTLKELAKRWRPEVYSSFKKRRPTPRWPTCTSRSTNWRTTASTS
jgi:oligoribonuclease